jgi:hypothetical protein
MLETKTASSSADITLDTDFTIEFSCYSVREDNIAPATDNVELRAEVEVSGGFQTSSYSNSLQAYAANGTELFGSGTSDAAIRLNNSGTAGVGNAAGEDYSGELTICNPTNTGGYIRADHKGGYRGTTGTLVSVYGHGYYGGSGAVTRLKFKMSSGNIASGTFKLYGIR